eukprot:s419_g24.t1
MVLGILWLTVIAAKKRYALAAALGNLDNLGNLGNLGNLVLMRRGRLRSIMGLDHHNLRQLKADQLLLQSLSQLEFVQWVQAPVPKTARGHPRNRIKRRLEYRLSTPDLYSVHHELQEEARKDAYAKDERRKLIARIQQLSCHDLESRCNDSNGLLGPQNKVSTCCDAIRVPLNSESCTGSVLRLVEEKRPRDEFSVEEADEMQPVLRVVRELLWALYLPAGALFQDYPPAGVDHMGCHHYSKEVFQMVMAIMT